MIRLNVTAGTAAVALSLFSVVAAIDAPGARAQTTSSVSIVEHTQPDADEIVPNFVAKAVVQAVPEPEAEAAAQGRQQAGSLQELVGTMTRNAPLDEQLQCLAGAIFFEARGEPLAGQLAVAEVVINRAASGRFPASYCGVVYQPSQFSFVKRGRMPAITTGSAAWERARAIAQIAHRNLWTSQAEGSLYFHARSVSPGWSNKRQAMARISSHVFYR